MEFKDSTKFISTVSAMKMDSDLYVFFDKTYDSVYIMDEWGYFIYNIVIENTYKDIIYILSQYDGFNKNELDDFILVLISNKIISE